MLTELGAFRNICRLCVALLIPLACFPLAALVFRPEATPASQPEKPPAADTPSFPENILGETPVKPPPGLPVYDRFTVAQRLQRGLPTALPAVAPYYGEKTVYLTFDDGPEPENTPAILKILKEAGIKATFFVVGTEAEKHPEILKRIYDEGHAVGNHSYNHVYRELYVSAAAYTSQLQHADDIIMRATGVRPRISRAPGGSAGSFTKEYWEALKQQGYAEVGWNISSGDASRAKAGYIVANITRQLDSQRFLWSHAIVLMHDGRGHQETVKALPAIIKLFSGRGFEFRVVNLETPPAW